MYAVYSKMGWYGNLCSNVHDLPVQVHIGTLSRVRPIKRDVYLMVWVFYFTQTQKTCWKLNLLVEIYPEPLYWFWLDLWWFIFYYFSLGVSESEQALKGTSQIKVLCAEDIEGMRIVCKVRRVRVLASF